jgi:fatty acid-binding protein DegV
MNSVLSSVGELLQIKPLLRMYDGAASNERIRTRKKAFQRLVELIGQYGPFEKIAFLHSEAAHEARALMEEVKHLLPEGDIWLEPINPVLGAHIGPGVVGFAGVSKG